MKMNEKNEIKKIRDFEEWVRKIEKKTLVLKNENGVEFVLKTSCGKAVVVKANIYTGNIDVYSEFIEKEKFRDFLNEIAEILEVEVKKIKVNAVKDLNKRITNLEKWLTLPQKNYQWWELCKWEEMKRADGW